MGQRPAFTEECPSGFAPVLDSGPLAPSPSPGDDATHNKKITFSPIGIGDAMSERGEAALAARWGWTGGGGGDTSASVPAAAAGEEWERGMFLAVFVHKRTKRERESGRMNDGESVYCGKQPIPLMSVNERPRPPDGPGQMPFALSLR